jgi:hypothetical protein
VVLLLVEAADGRDRELILREPELGPQLSPLQDIEPEGGEIDTIVDDDAAARRISIALVHEPRGLGAVENARRDVPGKTSTRAIQQSGRALGIGSRERRIVDRPQNWNAESSCARGECIAVIEPTMHNIRRDPIDVLAQLIQFPQRLSGRGLFRQPECLDRRLEPEEGRISQQG